MVESVKLYRFIVWLKGVVTPRELDMSETSDIINRLAAGRQGRFPGLLISMKLKYKDIGAE